VHFNPFVNNCKPGTGLAVAAGYTTSLNSFANGSIVATASAIAVLIFGVYSL